MTDPTLQLTFGDMITRVAEYLGIAYLGVDGTAAADNPVDAHDIDLVKRLVNDGYRKFIIANPRWRFLTPLYTLTLVAGTDTYDAPDGFYGVTTQEFIPDNNSGRPILTVVPESYIREMNANGNTSGDPQYLAIRPKALAQDNTDVAPRWEFVVWPNPSNAYAVKAPIRLMPNKLVNITDTPIAGAQHADAILALALAEAERQRDDKIGVQAANAAESLKRSMMLDAEDAPRMRGYNGDGSDEHGPINRRPYRIQVDTYNGNPV